MRDLAIMAVVIVGLPMTLRRPWIGILLWSWFAYMNPHRLSYGFTTFIPFAMIIAICTLLGIIFSTEKKRIPMTTEVGLLLLFIGWMFLTTTTALYQASAWEQMDKIAKIQLMTFVSLMLMTSRERIDQLIWVFVISLGYYGVKGGIFTIVTGGGERVWGPDGTFIGGNNEIGLAMIMLVPLMRYLHLQATKTWVRQALVASMLLTAVSIVGTQSRGAFLGIAAMTMFLWLKGRKKIVSGMLMVMAAGLIWTFMPESWHDRMNTVQTYEEDESAQKRINAWTFAFNLARERPLIGGGFETFRDELFQRYAPNPLLVFDAHSIYFEVLAEHGFVGLGIFLALGAATWFGCGRTLRMARRHPELKWAADLSAMLQVALIGYATAGTFLGLAYFDFYYHLIAVAVATRVLVVAHIKSLEPEPANRFVKRGRPQGAAPPGKPVSPASGAPRKSSPAASSGRAPG